MATRTETTLLCDFTGTPADGTVRFGYKGKDYVLYAAEPSLSTVRETLEDYAEVARPDTAPKANRAPNDAGKIRAWAQAQGLDVGDRGRISADIRQAYIDRNTTPTTKESLS